MAKNSSKDEITAGRRSQIGDQSPPRRQGSAEEQKEEGLKPRISEQQHRNERSRMLRAENRSRAMRMK
jgi:hypothetical protein